MRTALAILSVTLAFVTTQLHSQNEWLFDYRTILPPPDAIPRETARAVQTQRQYPPGGTCDMEKVYGPIVDATLREQGYTEQAAKDSFPTFAAYWTAHGWPTVELLDLYQFECAWNDWLWHTDTYLAIGPYIRPNFVCQSRGTIIAPDGWFDQAYYCETALGHYIGKHPQVYSDRSGQNPGYTPGTCLSIDHERWSKRAPTRVCLNSTAWGKDYGVIGGLAYTEGIQIENFRLVGNKSQVGTFTGLCTGVTLNEPGENSSLSYCMATDFPGPGYSIFNGTPFVSYINSAFNNTGPGFDHLGSNGLCNATWIKCSGDDNAGGLLKFRPKDAQSVGGGTHQVIGMKSESRTVLQIPIVVEGPMGDLNLTVDGMTANFDGPPCPYLIGGNWTGTQFEINARGIDLRSNTAALAKSSTATLTGGKPYSGNSFVWNDEGLAFKSRANMTLSTGTAPPTGSWTCATWSACVNGTQTRTCSCSGTCSDPKPAESQTCTGTPPPTGGAIDRTGWVVTASHTGTNEQTAWAIDGNLSSVWTSGKAQKDVAQWVRIDMLTARSIKRIDAITGWPNDHPRNLTVYLTNSTTMPNTGGVKPTTGATWTANLTGTGRYLYLRINQAPGVTNWTTIADLQFY